MLKWTFATRLATAWLGGCVLARVAVAQVTTGPASGPTTGPATTRAATSTKPADAGVAALIHQLGADDANDRDAAQRELVELGETATDALRWASDHDPDAEVRSRSAGALWQIRDRAANGATPVTLHVHDAPLPTVLKELGLQARAEITQAYVLAARPATVTIDADRRPFWDVMADLCTQAGVCPMPQLESPNHSKLLLYPTSRNWLAKGPHQVVGPFCVGVAGLDRMTSVDLSGPPLNYDTFMARLIVLPEPKLVVTQVSPMVVREATDDAGNSLVPPTQAAMVRALGRLNLGGRVPVRMVEARLRYPADHPGKRIVTLAGDLAVTLAQGAQRFEADDVLGRPRVTRPLPGVKVRVSVARQGAGFVVTVDCARGGMADAQWYAMTNRVNDLSLEDAAGHPLMQSYGWEYDQANSDAAFKASSTFICRNPAGANLLVNRLGVAANPAAVAPPPPGDPARVVWNVADRFKVVTLQVAFHDLPMP
jgi:hypothetical protein